MNVYLLEQNFNARRPNWRWDGMLIECVVVAPNEARARQLVSEQDTSNSWLDPKYVTCTLVSLDKETVVSSSYAGG